jgi:Replication-relaxation
MQKAMDINTLSRLIPVQLPVERVEVWVMSGVVLNKPRIRILSEMPVYHELTAEQLTRILGYSYRYMQDECKELTSLNMLQSVPVEKKPRDARVGNLPYVYVLGSAGRQYLLSEGGHVVWPRWRPEEERERAGYLHTLALNDVLINARTLQKEHPGFVLENFVHERVFRSKPIRVTTPERARPENLRPDLWLDMRDYNTHTRYVYSVEVNLTHLDRKRFIKNSGCICTPELVHTKSGLTHRSTSFYL